MTDKPEFDLHVFAQPANPGPNAITYWKTYKGVIGAEPAPEFASGSNIHTLRLRFNIGAGVVMMHNAPLVYTRDSTTVDFFPGQGQFMGVVEAPEQP